MTRPTLTPKQQDPLERQLRGTPDARVYRRTWAVLEYHRGRPVAQIAQMLRVTRQSVYNWLDAYAQQEDPEALVEVPRPGRPPVWTDERRAVLRALMKTTPDQLGAFAVNWTVPLLQDYLEQETGQRVCDDTIRQELRRQEYVWKRPRYVLDPDPEGEKKTLDPASRAESGSREQGAGGG